MTRGLLIVATAALVGGSARAQGVANQDGVTITFLANEGVML